MRRERHSYKRKAIAGVVSAVLFFAMLFTVGASYFLFVNYQNQSYVQSLVPRVNSLDTQGSETAIVTTVLLSSNNHVGFYLNNTGGMNINMTAFMLYASTGQPLICVGKGLPSSVCASQSTTFTICTNASCSSTLSPSPSFVVDNVGSGTGVVDTGYAYADTTVTLKILTSNGDTFSQTYPDTTSNNPVANALNAGAIGDLYLSFSSYTFYEVSSSSCPTGSGYSNYCLMNDTSGSGPGFAVSVSLSQTNIAFSVTLTNLNHLKDSIILDQFSILYQNAFFGHDHVDMISWYIANVGPQSNGMIPVMNEYQPVVLPYNTPVTVYYVAAGCLTASQGPNDPNASCNTMNYQGAVQSPGSKDGAGTSANVFILSNGWEYPAGSYQISNLAYSGTNYGQNTPFVSTLYY